jgi:hypothetical protein
LAHQLQLLDRSLHLIQLRQAELRQALVTRVVRAAHAGALGAHRRAQHGSHDQVALILVK